MQFATKVLGRFFKIQSICSRVQPGRFLKLNARMQCLNQKFDCSLEKLVNFLKFRITMRWWCLNHEYGKSLLISMNTEARNIVGNLIINELLDLSTVVLASIHQFH